MPIWAPDSVVIDTIRNRFRAVRPSLGPSTRLGNGSAPGENTTSGSDSDVPPLTPEPVLVSPSSHIGTPSRGLEPAFRYDCRRLQDSTVRNCGGLIEVSQTWAPIFASRFCVQNVGASCVVQVETQYWSHGVSGHDAATAWPDESKQVAPCRHRSATSKTTWEDGWA